MYCSAAAISQCSADDGSSSSGIGASLTAFSSSSSFTSSRSPLSDSASSTSGCGGAGEDDDADWRLEETRRTRGRRNNRRGRTRALRQRQQLGGATASGGGATEAKKKLKNAREKERVKNVRGEYEALNLKLGDRVERGSGHFSKVRTLQAAIRRVEHLLREAGEDLDTESAEDESTPRRQPARAVAACSTLEPIPPPPPPPQSINLSCDERLEEPDIHQQAPSNTSFDSLFQEEVYTGGDMPPAYFSYNSDFPPPVLGSPCLFPFSGGSPGPTLPPPSSSLVYSPDIGGHMTHPSGAAPGSIGGGGGGGPLSPLGVSPPPQHPYHCGSDVWMAIGCN